MTLGGQAEERPCDDGGPPTLLIGFARGVGWTYVGLVLMGSSNIFLAAWTVRRVGTGQFGLFALVTAMAGLLAMFDYALGIAVVRAGGRLARQEQTHRAEDLEVVHAAHGGYLMLGAAMVTLTVIGGVGLFVSGPTRPYLVETVVLLGLATSADLATAAAPGVAVGSRLFSLRTAGIAAGVTVRVIVALCTVDRFSVAGLAAAQFLGVTAERIVILVLLRSRVHWFDARPRIPDARALGRVSRFAGPLVALNISGQLLTVSDILVVAALAGAAAAGVFQVSTMLPLYAGAVLMTGYNVIFPMLAASDDRVVQEDTTSFLTRVFSYLCSVGLMLAIFLRRDVVTVVLGRTSAVGEMVLLLYCATCLINTVLHGMASLLIARGRQHLMSRAVAIELPTNIVLTVAFVGLFGAVGAATATLVTVVLMDFIVFPMITRREFLEPALATVARHGAVPATVGMGTAAAAALIGRMLSTPVARLSVGALSAAILGGVAGMAFLGSKGRTMLRQALTADTKRPLVPGPLP